VCVDAKSPFLSALIGVHLRFPYFLVPANDRAKKSVKSADSLTNPIAHNLFFAKDFRRSRK